MKGIAAAPIGLALSLTLLLHGGSAWAQTPPPQTPPPVPAEPTPTQAPPTSMSPDHLARVREGLGHESTLRLENGQLMIYVEIIAKWPTFAEVAKGYDLMNGPTGGGNPMSHQEFLNMVTPKELYGSGGISAPAVLVMALENYFGQKAMTKGLKEIKQISDTRDQKKIDQIRARIDAELAGLAALRGGI